MTAEPDPEYGALLDKAARLLHKAQRVVAFTGAGMSAESGVPTFRGNDGLWEGQRIEDVATPHAFERQPHVVWRFYHQRRANLGSVVPHPGHYALADLEATYFDNSRLALITQNVDGLHHVAGSRRVVELHGNIRRTRCTRCGRNETHGLEPLGALPTCGTCGGGLRPDIVWFGEMLPEHAWEQAVAATAACNLMLVIGTSAVVYPAAGLVAAAKQAGAAIVEINVARSAASDLADLFLAGPAGVILPQLVCRLREMS